MSYASAERRVLRALGARVRQLRQRRGWSQERLALECQLHRTYVGGVERGERNIAILNLKRIADALQVPLSELVADLADCKEAPAVEQ